MVKPPDEQVQVWFALTGFNASSFGMGAEVISPERVRLPSAPWFPIDAAKGDILRVQRGEDGQLWVQEKVQTAGYCAIKLMLTADSPLGATDTGTDAMVDKFAAFSVTGRGMFGVAVIDVPPGANLDRIRGLLEHGRRVGWWEYENLCVTDAWRTASTK